MNTSRKLVLVPVALVFGLLLPLFFVVHTTAAATITVNSTADDQNDDGECTLREAIVASNNDAASGAAGGECAAGSGLGDTIEFNITGAISLTSDLPSITETVTIDGYSDPDASENTAQAPDAFNGTLAVEIDASGATASAIYIDAALSTVRGLVINGAPNSAIFVQSGGMGSVIAGNYIGTNLAGSVADGTGQAGIVISDADGVRIGVDGTSPENADRNIISGNGVEGIRIQNAAASTTVRGNFIGVAADGTTDLGNAEMGVKILEGSDFAIIGGTVTGTRNVISGNGVDGISVEQLATTGVTIVGNYIGTNASGTGDLGNTRNGVLLDNSPSNTVGGSTSAHRNVISGNDSNGVWLYGDNADNNIISGNYIGVSANGTSNLGNASNGVHVSASTDGTLIGGTVAGSGNTIRFNGDNGVIVTDAGTMNNAIVGNSLSSNASPNIDLADNGVSANDANDADSGPNDLLNYPEWGLFDDDSGDTEVTYNLDVPAGSYRIETYSESGKTLVDTQNITHTGSGSETFNNTIAGNNYSNLRMTATKIDGGLPNGFGPTSEYSDAYSDGSEIITVNSTADDEDDDGECTLREAIIAANTDVESGTSDGECLAGSLADVLEFDIPGGGPHTISPSGGDLPAITADNVTIDGYTEAGAVENSGDYSACFIGTIMIELDGSGAGAGAIGLQIQANSVTVRGLAINNFSDDGINVSNNADSTEISGNVIGLNPAGTVDEGNTNDGIQLATSTNALIGGTSAADRNVISGNNQNGIYVSSTDSDVLIQGNCIGTGSSGTTDLGNGGDGISVTSEDATIIGGTTSGTRNVISGNGNDGIEFSNNYGDNSIVRGNYIGLGSNGTTALGNAGTGINSGAPGLTVGGTVAGARNTISGNDSYGFSNWGNGTATVQGNYFGYSFDGSSVFANGGSQAANATLNSNVQFGGTTAASRNYIASGGVSSGVTIFGGSPFGGSSAGGNTVQGNCIGTNLDCEPEAGYEVAAGVMLAFDSLNNVIGGTSEGAGNIIAGNAEGIASFSISGAGFIPLNNSILGNSIYESTGGSLFGIINSDGIGIDHFDNPTGNFTDFTEVGVNANDAGDGDTGANDYLNYPVLDNSSTASGELTIQFDLDVDETAPNGYRVEFFANDTGDASGNGEGQIYLGHHNVSGDSVDEIAPLVIEPGIITTGTYDITATVTERDNSTDGFGATSEFSAFLDDQLIIQPEDNDGDGVSDAVEDAGPNGGDANDDGTLDSEQGYVATTLDKSGDSYLTLVIEEDGECNQIEEFVASEESDMPEDDNNYDYPMDMNGFTVSCNSAGDSVNGSIYYHAENNLNG